MPSRSATRRNFLSAAVLAPALTAIGFRSAAAEAADPPARFLFTSRGKTGLARVDGQGLRYFDLNVPNQATWQPGPVFGDGQRVVMLSMEPRRDGPGRPFDGVLSASL
jgi:TolB protein